MIRFALGHFLDENVEWSLFGTGRPVAVLRTAKRPRCRGRNSVVRHVPSVIRLTDMRLEQVLVDGDRAGSYMRIIAVHASSGRTVSYRRRSFSASATASSGVASVFDSFDAAEQFLGHPIDTSLKAAPELATTGNRIAL